MNESESAMKWLGVLLVSVLMGALGYAVIRVTGATWTFIPLAVVGFIVGMAYAAAVDL